MPSSLRLRRLLCGVLLAALPATAFACDDVEAVRAAAYRQLPAGALPVTARFTDADSTACRAWPAQPGTTLLAVAQWAAPASEEARGGDLDLLLIDTASGRPLAWTRVADAVSSDALRFTGLRLDTARWQLDPATRAFGVRMDYNGSSGPNPFAQTELQLFVREGRQLRPGACPAGRQRQSRRMGYAVRRRVQPLRAHAGNRQCQCRWPGADRGARKTRRYDQCRRR